MGVWVALGEKQKEQVFALWKAGQSAGEIGSFFGVSRNVILGLIHRNKNKVGSVMERSADAHPANPKPGETIPRRRPPRARSPKATNPPPLPPEPFIEASMTPERMPLDPVDALLSLRGVVGSTTAYQCRFPVGTPILYFCDRDAMPGQPYCSEHHQLCCEPIRRRS